MPLANMEEINGEEELTERERRAVRRLIIDHERSLWFWGTIRLWAGWLSASIIGAYATYEAMTKFFMLLPLGK